VEPAKTTFQSSARRGLTFIETVCAVAMLALVAAAVFGAFNSIMAQQERQAHRLGAMELCNRLILQYLTDKDTMPNKTLPIVYGDERYRWELNEVPVKLLPARPDVADDRATNGTSAISIDRMQAITVTVWLSEESGGSYGYDARFPSATLTRLMDPIALRNPDVTNSLAHDPIKQREFLETFRTIGRNALAPKTNDPNNPGNPKPAPSPSGTKAGPSPSSGGAVSGGTSTKPVSGGSSGGMGVRPGVPMNPLMPLSPGKGSQGAKGSS
jgi:type II secretory pathway pseudopilin PulG